MLKFLGFVKEDQAERPDSPVSPESPNSPKLLFTQSFDTLSHLITPTTKVTPGQTKEVKFAISSQQGYKKTEGGTKSLHSNIEDVVLPSGSESPMYIHSPSQQPFYLFVLADGHGGSVAPNYFTKCLRDEAIKLMNSRDWKWDVEWDRVEFAKQISQTFEQLDLEWCKHKIQEFTIWKQNPSMPKPIDDGCTLVINIVHRNHLINVNVGDSRTILARRIVPERKRTPSTSSHDSLGSTSTTLTNPSTSDDTQKWTLHFASQDHSPDHPVAAWHVASRQGIFINEDGTKRNALIQPPNERMKWEPFCCCCAGMEESCGHEHDHTTTLAEKRYHALLNARIYRPPTPFIRSIGIPHLKTLNLAATMGDILFKVDGGVISSRPDVTFVELHPKAQHMLLFATDGLWDHLRWQANPLVANVAKPCQGSGQDHGTTPIQPSTAHLQNLRVLEWISNRLNSMGVSGIASALCERERDEQGHCVTEGKQGPAGAAGEDGVYWPWCARFDDVTVGLVWMDVGAV